MRATDHAAEHARWEQGERLLFRAGSAAGGTDHRQLPGLCGRWRTVLLAVRRQRALDPPPRRTGLTDYVLDLRAEAINALPFTASSGPGAQGAFSLSSAPNGPLVLSTNTRSSLLIDRE